ncbi:MAG: DUF4845 domain-containing protein [Burkholderiales bacterium]|nr:DUF4845 domain-containing protein [Burkholderiales bacterium]
MTRTARAQAGLSLIAFLFVAAVVLVCALLVFRTFPAYMEYYTVQKGLEASLREVSEPTPVNVQRAMARKLSADYVDSITVRDIEVAKVGNQITASVSWQKKLPLVYNVSLLLDFDASATR